MSEAPGRRAARRSLVPVLCSLSLVIAACAPSGAGREAFAADENELLRAIKSDVFDQQWPDVLANCDRFIKEFTRSSALPRAYYYRAQALDSLRRPEEAVEAYTEFIKRFPSETGALKEDAILKRITLARQLYEKGSKRHLFVILEAMDYSGYPRVYAAIEASKIDHRPAQQKALPILKECARSQPEEELKNECVVAILRLGEVPPSGPVETRKGDEVKLFRVEVYDKNLQKVSVTVNLPIAFVDLAIESLEPWVRQMISKEMVPSDTDLSTFDYSKLIQSLKEGGPQTLVEIDDESHRIRVWIE